MSVSPLPDGFADDPETCLVESKSNGGGSSSAQVLGLLTNAAEYLVHSRILMAPDVAADGLAESLRLLRRSSRAIFQELHTATGHSVSIN